MTERVLKIVAAAVALVAIAAEASAQQRVPDRDRPDAYQRQERTYQAGVFDYYVLALSWSPTYCAGITDNRYDPQCHARDGRRYAFVLHGLWPQFEQRWPQFCASPDNGYVPEPVAQKMLDIMPSRKLVFHEYRKHGTCSGLGVDGYFDLSRRLFESIKIPQRYVALDDERLFVGPDEIKREFIALNPKMPADAIAVECGGAGNRLKEVRVCFNKGGGFRACGRNEDQQRLCSAERMYVPPVRVAAQRATPSPEKRVPQQRLVPGRAPEGELLPGPR